MTHPGYPTRTRWEATITSVYQIAILPPELEIYSECRVCPNLLEVVAEGQPPREVEFPQQEMETNG